MDMDNSYDGPRRLLRVMQNQDMPEDINRRLQEMSDRLREANRQMREQRGERPFSDEVAE